MFYKYVFMKRPMALYLVTVFVVHLCIERTISNSIEMVKPKCTPTENDHIKDCSWNWTEKNGNVHHQECQVQISEQFICQGAMAKPCDVETECYANPFEKISYEWQETNARNSFNLKLSIEIPRDVYHWKLYGIGIHIENKCYYINFSSSLSHHVFNGKRKMLFVFDCISNLLPNTSYYLQVDASPIPNKTLGLNQWAKYIMSPPTPNPNECEKHGNEVIWTADYINITILHGSLAVEFAIAPPACKFEVYHISISDEVRDYQGILAENAIEKVVNGTSRKVITLEFIINTNDIGKYQLMIRGSSPDNKRSSSVKIRNITLSAPTTLSASMRAEPTTLPSTTTEPTTLLSTTTEPTTLQSTTTEPTTLPSTTTEPTTLPSTTTEPTTLPSTAREPTLTATTRNDVEPKSTYQTNTVKHQIIYSGLGCIIGVLLVVYICRLRSKPRNRGAVVQTYLQDELKSTALSSRQSSVSDSDPPSEYMLVISGHPDKRQFHDAITISSQPATGENIDIVATGSV